MAVDADFYPGRQLIQGALPTHRTALAHGQFFMAAFHTLGPLIGRRAQATRAGAMAAFGRGRPGFF